MKQQSVVRRKIRARKKLIATANAPLLSTLKRKLKTYRDVGDLPELLRGQDGAVEEDHATVFGGDLQNIELGADGASERHNNPDKRNEKGVE